MDRWNVWRCERGGLDFVQVIIAMMIVAIAAVSTTYSIYVGRLTLDEKLQEKQAIRYAREEMEYWSGRVLVSPPNSQEMLGDAQTGRRVLIDPRKPNDASDNIWGKVFYARITPVNLQVTGEELTDYYKIHVWVVWPDNVPEEERHRVDLYSSMIQMNS
jgi:hypothetical protein